eukprot:360322-Chlamydomonas_euryale.AAC.7
MAWEAEPCSQSSTSARQGSKPHVSKAGREKTGGGAEPCSRSSTSARQGVRRGAGILSLAVKAAHQQGRAEAGRAGGGSGGNAIATLLRLLCAQCVNTHECPCVRALDKSMPTLRCGMCERSPHHPARMCEHSPLPLRVCARQEYADTAVWNV